MTAALESKAATQAQVAAFRQEFLKELPVLAREYIDTARAEATTQAFEKVMNTALKVIEGLQVESKADKYANLPIINFTIGAGMQMTTTVQAPPTQDIPLAEVVEAQDPQVPASPFATSASKTWALPDDVTDLIPELPAPGPSVDEAAVMAALDAAAGAMALPD